MIIIINLILPEAKWTTRVMTFQSKFYLESLIPFFFIQYTQPFLAAWRMYIHMYKKLAILGERNHWWYWFLRMTCKESIIMILPVTARVVIIIYKWICFPVFNKQPSPPHTNIITLAYTYNQHLPFSLATQFHDCWLLITSACTIINNQQYSLKMINLILYLNCGIIEIIMGIILSIMGDFFEHYSKA